MGIGSHLKNHKQGDVDEGKSPDMRIFHDPQLLLFVLMRGKGIAGIRKPIQMDPSRNEDRNCCCCSTEEPAADAVSPADVPDAVPSCCRHKDRSPEEYKALVNRLSRIEGQVRGVRGMLEKDAYCVDILVQVAAVNSALNSFAKELLAQHMSTCVADDLRAGSNEKLDELIKLLPRLMK